VKLVLFAAWLFAASLTPQAHAASPSQRPRSLQEVIDLTLAEGQNYPMEAEMAPRLGFPAREFPHKRLRYKQSECPDRKEHTFGVLYEVDENGKEHPLHLLIGVGTGKKKDGVTILDAMTFLTKPDGTLEQSLHDYGRLGEIKTDQLKLSAKVQKQAKAELTFHTKVAFALSLRPAK